MIRTPALAVLAALAAALPAACTRPDPPPRRVSASVENACRAEAERVMRERSRANRDRLDDMESRFGAEGFAARRIRATETLDRDRIYRECLGRASPGEAPASQPAPTMPVQVRP